MHRRRVYMIRHAACKGNLEGRYVGRTDEAALPQHLSALEKRKKIEGRVYTSPMLRCIQTAQAVCVSTEYTCFPEWCERDFGEYEYKNYQELSAKPAYQEWIDSGGTLPFPAGETEEDFYARCIRGVKKMLAKEQEIELKCCKECQETEHSNSGEEAEQVAAADCHEEGLICMLHGGVMMALLCLYGSEGKGFYDYQCKNGEGYLTRWEWESGEAPCIYIINKVSLPES